MSLRYAVIGNPIEHSKSPLIHQSFAAQLGIDLCYEKILAPLEGFKSTVESLIAQGYQGANVTAPFKLQAFVLANELTPRAQLAGAVNTLIFREGNIIGDNTDGEGLVTDIELNLGVSLADKNILLLGAGGAAKGVLPVLLCTRLHCIIVANRTVEKARQLIDALGQHARQITLIEAYNYEALNDAYFAKPFDVIINATSAGLNDAAIPLADALFLSQVAPVLAYDMMYGRQTPFMAQAQKNGARVADGLGMLVEQAAWAFNQWHGVMPETAPVIAKLRQA